MDIKITLFVGKRLLRARMPSSAQLKRRLSEPFIVSQDWIKENQQAAGLKIFFAVKGYAFNPEEKLEENPEVYVGFPLSTCETHYASSHSVSVSEIKKYTKIFKETFEEEPQILFGFTLD